jgi:hypothetical protein
MSQTNVNSESFEAMLTGGHPNSLGRTLEVVDTVLSNADKLSELFNCYFSSDEIVRLRTSNAIKRISKEKPEWLVPYIDRLLNKISTINQASTQWTLANLFQTLAKSMSPEQQISAQAILKRNLESHTDWIVLNNTMQTLSEWAERDEELKGWLIPHLERLKGDSRKSVAKNAEKLRAVLS